MQPQLLSKVQPNADIALGPGAFPARPHLAALVAEVIAFWSEVELQRGRYLGSLLGNSSEGAVAMYLAISSAAARRAALDAASKTALGPEEYELFFRITKQARGAQRERNTFAHGLWGYSDELPDALLLVNEEYRLKDMLRLDNLMQQMKSETIRWPIDSIDIDRSKISVYRESDLRKSLRAVNGIHRITYYLAALPALQGQERVELRRRLTSELPRPRPWP